MYFLVFAFIILIPVIIIGTLIFMVRTLYNTYKYRVKQKSSKPDPEWKSEWRWDETTQKWVHPNSVKSEPEQREEKEEIDYKNAYIKRYLFSKNELYAYKKLRDIAEIKGYMVLAKVRLLDLIDPIKGHKKYKTLLYKIQAKHVDFVITDRDMHIKAIIELDDSSHDTDKGKERDDFVNLILRSVGYKVIHTRYITNDILDTV